jgi:RHS repeat-associated protein
MSEISKGTDTHEYDGDGRRMRSKLNGASNWTHFVHDELSESILVEYQAAPNPTAKAIYTYGIGLISLSITGVSPTKRWFHFDGLGSTAALTDLNENITDTYEYSAFGIQENSTGSSVNPFRYVGQWGYYDDVARGSQYGLLLLGVRYYSTDVGRFLTWDTLSNVNRYRYVDNESTDRIDWTGKQKSRRGLVVKIVAALVAPAAAAYAVYKWCTAGKSVFDCAKCLKLRRKYGKFCRDCCQDDDCLTQHDWEKYTYTKCYIHCMDQMAKKAGDPTVVECIKNCANLWFSQF